MLQQPPAPRALAQHGPAAVGQAAQRLPGPGLQAEQPADGGADRAAVADHHERAVVRQLVRALQHHRGRPVGDLGLQLTAAAPDRLPALPRRVLLAVALDDLLVDQPLPRARVGLAQPRVMRDGQPRDGGQLGGRGRRPLQVGGDDRVRLQGGQQPGRAARLRDTGVRELYVQGALETPLYVPGRLAVAPQDDAAAAAPIRAVQLSSPPEPPSAACACAYSAPLPRVASASAGSSSCGQSFQSRSSA
ncbi:hypothetical protein SMALB_3353 [Streptomyces malaysiensis]|uniref:Uncharacterized protein n=1 Tax=Streptomyces malaysiensis TaxID=92644 RepID=A0A7X6AWF7_STRMQ|nr:hypothetical protein [Streptomyces malaysiensis]